MIAHRRGVKRKLREYGIIIGDSSLSIHPDVREINRRKMEDGNRELKKQNYLGNIDRQRIRERRERPRSSRNGDSRKERSRNHSFEYKDGAIENLAIIDLKKIDESRRRPSSRGGRNSRNSSNSRKQQNLHTPQNNRLPKITKQQNNYFNPGDYVPH